MRYALNYSGATLKIKITQCSGGFRLEMFRKDAPYASIILTYKTFRENEKRLFVLAILLLSSFVKGVMFSMERFRKGFFFCQKWHIKG